MLTCCLGAAEVWTYVPGDPHGEYPGGAFGMGNSFAEKDPYRQPILGPPRTSFWGVLRGSEARSSLSLALWAAQTLPP